MTRRDFYNAVINANFNDDATEFAKAEIAKLDATNEKRKATPSKTAVANEPIKAKIVETIKTAGCAFCAADIGSMLDITTQKASALLRQLVEAEALVAEEKKVPKKGAVKFYSVK